MNRTTRGIRAAFANLTAGGVSIVMLTPIYLVFVNALKTRGEASSMGVGLPADPQWQNFSTVIEEGKLAGSFVNSVLYALASTALAVAVSAMAAYVLSRNRTRLHGAIYLLLIAGIAMPTNFVTLTKVLQWTHLMNTQAGIIFLYAATQIPFSVFLLYAFIDTLPRDLDEAALIDGCGPLRAFFSVILPLLTPAVATLSVLSILNAWNEFLMPLYFLNSSSKWPMTLAVYNFFGQYQSDWSLVSADVVLTILPVIVIHIAAQRFILSGASAGAVKG